MLPAGGAPAENAVVVAVKAEREISRSALEWTLTHIVRPGDFVTLLAVIPSQNKGRRWRLWSFPKFSGDCGTHRARNCASRDDSKRGEVSASCSQMALQFHGGEQNEVNMRIKVVMSPEGAAEGGGAVVAESKRVGANWVVIDRELKQETKHCMEELQCNIVLMKRNHAKVLRLNLGVLRNSSNSINNNNNHCLPPPPSAPLPPESPPESEVRLKHSTPISSPEPEVAQNKASNNQECHLSLSGSSASASPFSLCERNPLFENVKKEKLSSTNADKIPPLPTNQHVDRYNEHWAPQKHIYEDIKFNQKFRTKDVANHSNDAATDVAIRTLQEKFTDTDHGPATTVWPENCQSHVRDAMSLFRASPSMPPPLCSVCQYKAPVFGKPPRWFTYGEIQDATDQFSDDNYLAEGGFGWVYRGTLNDGQVVAVKRLKAAGGTKGDEEFRAEVEALSRAQHRNVVMLIGYCVEGMERILVYEYICNGSLESHLYGILLIQELYFLHNRSFRTPSLNCNICADHNMPPLEWHVRVKIANGTARGLRYLHEDCRVGFVHRDMRPNNILLTHDFEALVGDFGLARWQLEGALSVDTRVIGTFGYLAPEYIETGMITEKADVYAFGVVLLELLTGRRAMDLSKSKGQQFLVEWVRPVIAPAAEGGRAMAIDHFLDPRLDQNEAQFFTHQLHAMAHAAALCLRRDPQTRPTMSKVLRILEGEDPVDVDFSIYSTTARDGCINRASPKRHTGPRGSHSQRFAQHAISDAMFADRNRAHAC